MDPVRLLQYALWIGGWGLSLAVVVTMLQRKLRLEFPFFFAYALYQVASGLLLFALYQRGVYADYFYAYWTTSALGIGLGLAVVYEVFQHVFRPYTALRGLGSMLFRWATLVLLLVGVVTALSSPSGPSPMITAIMSLERSIRMMQCGLLLLLLLFSPKLGVSWRSHLFGITAGLGGYSAVALTQITLRAHLNIPSDAAYSLINSLAYTLAAATWCGYLLAPEPGRLAVRVQPVPDGWDFALQSLTRPAAPDSFLSNMQKTVDRVLDETNGKNGGNGKH